MVLTLEGVVPARTGDAIITGVGGERWPVGRPSFDLKYDPVPPLQRGLPGAFCPRPLPTVARQMDAKFSVQVAAGALLCGKPGDWPLEYEDGKRAVVAAAIFDLTYELA